jgi:hypothetical protein
MGQKVIRRPYLLQDLRDTHRVEAGISIQDFGLQMAFIFGTQKRGSTYLSYLSIFAIAAIALTNALREMPSSAAARI